MLSEPTCTPLCANADYTTGITTLLACSQFSNLLSYLSVYYIKNKKHFGPAKVMAIPILLSTVSYTELVIMNAFENTHVFLISYSLRKLL
jgi:hypothetical protein